MIFIEFMVNIAKSVLFYVSRFFFWFFLARDCKHCKYGKTDRRINGIICDKGVSVYCCDTSKRKHFERGKWII